MEVFVHNIKNVRNCSFKTNCKDIWSVDQMASWKKIKDSGFEIIYNGPDKNEAIIEPFFKMDNDHIGIKCDIGFSAIAQANLIIMPLQNINAPPIVPLIYEIDKWCLELTLLIKNQNFTIKNGDSLAYCLVANIEKNEIIQKDLSSERDNMQQERFSTRKNDFTSNDLDNYYEIVTKNNKPFFSKKKIFTRKYQRD